MLFWSIPSGVKPVPIIVLLGLLNALTGPENQRTYWGVRLMGKNTWKRKWNENELNKVEKDTETDNAWYQCNPAYFENFWRALRVMQNIRDNMRLNSYDVIWGGNYAHHNCLPSILHITWCISTVLNHCTCYDTLYGSKQSQLSTKVL